MSNINRIGWLANLETLAANPERLVELHNLLGITTVWLESNRWHTAGYALSPNIWRKSPFRDWRNRPGLARHRQARGFSEEIYPVLPGVLAGVDDEPLLEVLRVARENGIEIWGHVGLWSYAAALYPEFALRGLNGELMPEEQDRWGDGFCPNQSTINTWIGNCLEDCIERYSMDGIEIDHARYPPPASLPNLLTCTCAACIRQASRTDENLTELVNLVKEGFTRARQLPCSRVVSALRDADNLLDLMDELLPAHVASRWFTLRCRNISYALEEFANRAHRAAGTPFLFGIDVFPPSIAFFGGHNYTVLEMLDYFTGGFGLIGWENAAAVTCAKWTEFILQTWPGLDEENTLRQILRLAGLNHLDLPLATTRLMHLEADAMARLQQNEMIKFAAIRPAGKPVYPPVNLDTLGIEGTGEVISTAATYGLDGVMLAGLEFLAPESLVRLSRFTIRYG